MIHSFTYSGFMLPPRFDLEGLKFLFLIALHTATEVIFW